MTIFTYATPTVGGSEDTWGTTLNANWNALGAFIGSLDSTELAVLDGITATTAELNLLDGATLAISAVTATATELNHVNGVTSPIQAQINAKAPSTSPSFTGTVGLGANWAVTQVGSELKFAYNGTNRMKLDSSGNLTVTGNVTAYGSV